MRFLSPFMFTGALALWAASSALAGPNDNPAPQKNPSPAPPSQQQSVQQQQQQTVQQHQQSVIGTIVEIQPKGGLVLIQPIADNQQIQTQQDLQKNQPPVQTKGGKTDGTMALTFRVDDGTAVIRDDFGKGKGKADTWGKQQPAPPVDVSKKGKEGGPPPGPSGSKLDALQVGQVVEVTFASDQGPVPGAKGVFGPSGMPGPMGSSQSRWDQGKWWGSKYPPSQQGKYPMPPDQQGKYPTPPDQGKWGKYPPDQGQYTQGSQGQWGKYPPDQQGKYPTPPDQQGKYPTPPDQQGKYPTPPDQGKWGKFPPDQGQYTQGSQGQWGKYPPDQGQWGKTYSKGLPGESPIFHAVSIHILPQTGAPAGAPSSPAPPAPGATGPAGAPGALFAPGAPGASSAPGAPATPSNAPGPSVAPSPPAPAGSPAPGAPLPGSGPTPDRR